MSGPVDPTQDMRLVLRIQETHDLDNVDTCLRRLLSLRTRIETNWPQGGNFIPVKSQDLKPDQLAQIADLLTALPTPLPLVAGGEPKRIIRPDDTDMRAAAGRAVDAGFALLAGATMDTRYPVEVKMLEPRRYDSAGPITVSDATVGLLVSTIIGTLEAISELVQGPVKINPAPLPPTKPRKLSFRRVEQKRGPSVPRI